MFYFLCRGAYRKVAFKLGYDGRKEAKEARDGVFKGPGKGFEAGEPYLYLR